jgi:hypothetical protein
MTVPAAATRLTPVSATADARGLAAASTAFVIWGVLPLYLKQLQHVPVLSRKLFANVNSLFANESDGYKTTSAPSAFRCSWEEALGSGQEPPPEQSERHYRNCHQEDLSHDRNSPMSRLSSRKIQLKRFNANTETSSAADPATDFRHSQIMCFRSHGSKFGSKLIFFLHAAIREAINHQNGVIGPGT